MKIELDWKEGTNDTQHYWDVKVGDVYMCVFANKWNPDVYMGMIDDGGSRMIYDKTRNDRVRKREGLPKGCHVSKLHSVYILTGDPEYMKAKVERCYFMNKREISA